MLIPLKRIWTKSIARQLMLGIALVHAVLMTIFVVDLVNREKTFLIDHSQKQALGLAKTLATNSTSWVLAQDVIGMEEIIKSQSGFPSLMYAMLMDTKGKVLAYTDTDQVGKYVDDEISKTLLKVDPEPYTLVDDPSFIDIAAPIFINNQQIGWARVAISRTGITDNIKYVTQNGLIYILVAILVGTIFAWFMSRGLTTDIRELVSRANRLQQGEEGIDFVLDREDELGKMAANFQELNKTLSIQVDTLGREIKAKEDAIHKRDLTEEKLRKAINIIDNSSAIVFRWKNETDWPVEYVSKNVTNILGYSEESFMSGEILYSEIIHPDDLHRVANEVAQNSNKKGIKGFIHEPYRVIATDGSIKWLEDKTNLIRDDNGNVTHFEGIIQDISFQVEAKESAAAMEERLQQSQKMEAIGTLAGGITHDFNNILSPILGYTEMALETIPADSQTANDLKKVLKASNRAKELVKQILAFSRQSEQDLHPLKIQLVAKEALKLLRSFIPTTIEIKQNIDPQCGAVLVDPTQIHQIIMNLCTNAYHAMRETGGVLGVVLTPVELGLDDMTTKMDLTAGLYVQLEVSDTGCGMDKIVLERIFDPYYTTKAKGEGTGLGLSVVHGIVKSLHGDITVYSEPGKGTTFHVYFPVVETEEKQRVEEEVADRLPAGDEHVLVVDDEETIVDMEQQMLSSLGYQVSRFTNSEEALKAFRTQPNTFDLIITDMTMPKITGLQLTQEVLAVRSDIPVIMCTGFSELINEEKAQEAGIGRYLMKPLLKKDLAIAVREVLDQKKS